MVSETVAYVCELIQEVVAPLFAGGIAEKRVEIRKAATAIAGELSRFEKLLETSPWLFGYSISEADISVFPWIQSLLRAAGKDEAKSLELSFLRFEARYPHIALWVQRIEQISGYERTYPSHWR
jgi:glutathione S-transferase